MSCYATSFSDVLNVPRALAIQAACWWQRDSILVGAARRAVGTRSPLTINHHDMH